MLKGIQIIGLFTASIAGMLLSDDESEPIVIDLITEHGIPQGQLMMQSEVWKLNGQVELDLTLKNESDNPICVLKREIIGRSDRNKYKTYSSVMLVKDHSGNLKKYAGALAYAFPLQDYLEIKPGSEVVTSFNLTDLYDVHDINVMTRNFIFYAYCDKLNIGSGLVLDSMAGFQAPIAKIGTFLNRFHDTYFSLGGSYSDTGWIKHGRK